MPEPLADRLCELTVERILREGYTDDVTVLAAQRLPAATPPLQAEAPAVMDELLAVRDRLSGWLEGLAVTARDLLAGTLIATELITNVVDHAYVSRRGRFRLTAELDDHGGLRLVVPDDGRWREAGGGGGRGLPLVRSLCEEFHIERGTGGTIVTRRYMLGHPAVVGGAHPAEPGERMPRRFETVPTRRDPAVVEVRGAVDAVTVGLLRTEVLRHGSAPLVFDLSPVDLLASAGVQLLHDMSMNHQVRVAAASGSPARYVLELAGLESLLLDSIDETHQ